MAEPIRFLSCEPDQMLLMPPSLNGWLTPGYLAHYIRDVIGNLDLRAIEQDYEATKGGRPGYHPRIMVGLLLCADGVGSPSSRKIQRQTWESEPFRVLTVDAHPDHATLAEFRRYHLKAMMDLMRNEWRS